LPSVEKIRGQGGMTTRQLTRIILDVFYKAYAKMKTAEYVFSEKKALSH